MLALAGVSRACLCFRVIFQHSDSSSRLIGMQVLGAELVERFEFSLAKDDVYEIQRVPAGMMIPLVRGKWHLGSVIPLCVSAAK